MCNKVCPTTMVPGYSNVKICQKISVLFLVLALSIRGGECLQLVYRDPVPQLIIYAADFSKIKLLLTKNHTTLQSHIHTRVHTRVFDKTIWHSIGPKLLTPHGFCFDFFCTSLVLWLIHFKLEVIDPVDYYWWSSRCLS